MTAHVHIIDDKKFYQRRSTLDAHPERRHLSRVERLVFSDSYGPTDISFTLSKGVIGACCLEKREQNVDFVKTNVNTAGDEQAWYMLPKDNKQGLSWEDQRQLVNRNYGGVVAEPVRHSDGTVIGVVSLGLEKGLQSNLRTPRVKQAMGTAAVDVSRAFGPLA